jgi:hypothetical protein
MDLLPLDEVRRRLRIVGQPYLGFRPRRGLSGGRLASLRSAFPDGHVPPIEVQELGGSYFVADGHHRVALAHEQSVPPRRAIAEWPRR